MDFLLGPKLRLDPQAGKLRFYSVVQSAAANQLEAELRNVRAQAELGYEERQGVTVIEQRETTAGIASPVLWFRIRSTTGTQVVGMQLGTRRLVRRLSAPNSASRTRSWLAAATRAARRVYDALILWDDFLWDGKVQSVIAAFCEYDPGDDLCVC